MQLWGVKQFPKLNRLAGNVGNTEKLLTDRLCCVLEFGNTLSSRSLRSDYKPNNERKQCGAFLQHNNVIADRT